MNWPATIANTLWLTSSLPAAMRFRSSLERPNLTQEHLLLSLVASNADSAYGRRFRFERIRNYQDFAARVPVVRYSDLEPWIEQIQSGNQRILTNEPVTHLIPTSGSSGARKLIPFTRGLQREFNRAIAPWMADLVRQHPGMLLGPAYWSISPPLQKIEARPSEMPVGFADDADYLGGGQSRLARAALVAPRRLQAGGDLNSFRYETLFALLKARELRFISVWHPSFLTLLIDALPGCWEKLLWEIATFDRSRARTLRQCNPTMPATLWPKLCAVSCWGDGMAELPMSELRSRMPGVSIQPKGLLATEACITIPIGGQHPVAIESHFFEFIDDAGQYCRSHELQLHDSYEVVVTTGGGLWRYRLGDRVRVKGFVGKTPSLQFLGRAGNVSDLFGEKLCEVFVADVIKELLNQEAVAPTFAMLAPHRTRDGWGYRLYLEGKVQPDTSNQLEALLLRNPHYSVCRRLGQLGPATIREIGPKAYERFVTRLGSAGMSLGEIKPSPLSTLHVWEDVLP